MIGVSDSSNDKLRLLNALFYAQLTTLQPYASRSKNDD